MTYRLVVADGGTVCDDESEEVRKRVECESALEDKGGCKDILAVGFSRV